MVVFSASIVSNRKILLSRQFVEMTRGDVETYLNRFIKKIEQFCLSNEYTYMEIDDIRFVYQAIDSIYLILMTPINSNIIEDMDTLQLFCQVLYDCCNNPPPVTEDLIANNCFEVIFAFDEIISFGYKESVNLSQIKTCLEMESQEEKLHKLIRQNKENEEKERRRHIANKLDKERTNETFNQSSYTSANANSNIVKSSLSGIAALAESVGVGKIAKSVGIGPIKNISRSDSSNISNPELANNQRTFGIFPNESNIQSINAPGKGMYIGKKKPASETKQSVDSPPNYMEKSSSDLKQKDSTDQALDITQFEDDCSIIEEKIECLINIDGTIQSKVEIQGTFQVTLLSEAFPDYSITEDPRFQFKTHPNLSKEKFQDSGKLALKDGINCTLPVSTLMPLVKWRSLPNFQSHQLELPLSFSCWPLDTGSGFTNITIEIEPSQPITDFKLNIPLTSISTHSKNMGAFELNKSSCSWEIPQLSPSETAVLELSTAQTNFLPIDIFATTSNSVCKIGVIKNENYVNPKVCTTKYNITVNQ